MLHFLWSLAQLCFLGACGLEPLGVLWSMLHVLCQEFRNSLGGGGVGCLAFLWRQGKESDMHFLVHTMGHRFVG